MLIKITSLFLTTSLTLSANSYFTLLKEEEYSLWVSLFALAIVSMISLFLSSEQLKELDKKHKIILEKEKELEKKQQFILEFMGGKIETSTKGIIKHRKILEKNVFETMDSSSLQEEMKKFQESESLLLDATHELIDFLKIKSGTLEIKNEPYKVSNVLNEIYSNLHNVFKKNRTELIYDIDLNISPVLLGDSRRLEQILTTLLNDAISRSHIGSIILKAEILENQKILINIHNPNKVMLDDEVKALLENYSLKEEYKSQEKLYIYIVYEMIKQMQGNLTVTSSEKNGTNYRIELPYEAVDVEKITEKLNYSDIRVLLVIEDVNLLGVLKDKLIKNKVNVTSYQKGEVVKLQQYNMIIIDNQLLDTTMASKIDVVKKHSDIDLIVLKNTYESEHSQDINSSYKTLYKPLQNHDIIEILDISKKERILHISNVNKDIESSSEMVIVKDRKGITRESFKQFSNLHILIVDDNSMNQKILQGVFSNSGMVISIANNGLEALEEVKKTSEFDLIFMDTNMPVMDGYEASRRIRELRSMKMLPIIAMESIGFHVNEKDTKGINAFLHKPFKIGQLYMALLAYTNPNSSTVKHVFNKLNKYNVNKDILNIQVGIAHSNTAIFYKEVLKEVSISLKNSEEVLETFILKSEHKGLKSFLLDNIRLTEIIGATGLRKILIEIIQTFDYKQEHMLQDYISLYKKELHLLMAEIEEYLKT